MSETGEVVLHHAALPEEVSITKAAVKRNFAVVSFSSLDRTIHRCWDTSYPPEKSKDIATVGISNQLISPPLIMRSPPDPHRPSCLIMWLEPIHYLQVFFLEFWIEMLASRF